MLGQSELDFLVGDGEMARLFRSFDWHRNALGVPVGWPQGLRTAVRIMLTNRHPMFIFWGPEHICLYNDAYRAILGDDKHPSIFGGAGKPAWEEIWPDIGPQLKLVLAGEGATWHENQRLPILRNGTMDEVYWTYSYGPLEDSQAPSGVGGVLVICNETTTRVLSERRISSELDRMRRLFDQAPGFMCVLCGPDHIFEIANGAYTDLIAHSDIIGRPVSLVIPEAASQGLITLLDKVYVTGEPYVGTQQRLVLDRDGSNPVERFLDFVYAPVVDEAGRTTGVFCQGIDVTVKVRTERAITESENRFREMADAAPVMIWVTDPQGHCTYLNARWFERTGQTPDEALGLGWTGATHPDDQGRVTDAFLAANERQAAFRIEYRLRMADGGYRWVLDAANPRFTASGDYVGYVGSVIDIDDRHETEERIQRSESRFRAAVGAIQGHLWTNNAAGEMVGEQEGWHALTGQTPEQYQGSGWSSAVHPDDAPATLAAWEAAVASRSVFAHEHRVRRHDGQWRDFAVRAVPIFGSDGAIVEWVGIHTDITEQRFAETALVAFNNQLEHRVETEVAARLKVENALRQSQKMDALGQLTGGIAHDFSNMLTVVSSAFNMLQRRLPDADPAIARFITAGQDAATRAAGLAKRMLAFARQEPLTPELTDINDVLLGIEQLLAHSLGKAVDVEYRLGEGLWQARVDRNQLENAILNLAVNARDAISQDGRLLIATRNVELGEKERPDRLAGEFVQISVSDNGAGMTAEVRAKVFEPFFTTKPAGQGTGLGLSQVYGFVRQADGNVDIISELGQGTRVEIHLPRAG